MHAPARATLFMLLLFPIAFSQGFGEETQSLASGVRGALGASAMALLVIAAVIYTLGQVLGADYRARAIVWSTGIFTAVLVGGILWVIFTFFIALVDQELASNLTRDVSASQAKFIVLALGMGAGVTISMYFLGNFLQHAQLQALAKEEVAALFFTFVLILSWSFIKSTLFTIAIGLLCGSGGLCQASDMGGPQGNINSHADLAAGSLEILLSKMKSFYGHLWLFEILIGFLSTINFPLMSPFPAVNILTFSFAPYSGLSMLSNAHTVIVEAIGYLVTFLYAKQFILEFARYAIPPILFPLGLAMRAFPFLRTTGSSVIAASIALYFIYPASILLTNYLIFDVYKPADFVHVPKIGAVFGGASYEKFEESVKDSKTQSDKLLEDFKAGSNKVNEDVKGNQYRGIVGTIGDFLSSVRDTVVGFFTNVYQIARSMLGFGGDIISNLFFAFTPAGAAGGLYRFVIEEVINIGQFMALTLVGAFIEITITVTMYRNIAALIGGEVEIAGLAKLV